MTPELKTACEVIFQEHKTSNQIKWNRDAFRGQLSIGLSELAKETLVKKKIIILPNKSKKIVTSLNPVVATAGSFEEAEAMISSTAPKWVNVTTAVEPTPKNNEPAIVPPVYNDAVLPTTYSSEKSITLSRWYIRPFFYYFMWPLCAAIAGAIITFLIDRAYTELFWR